MRGAVMSAADLAWFYQPKDKYRRRTPVPVTNAGHRTISRVTAMKFATARPCSNAEAAARKLIEIANSVEVVQDGRIHSELINAPFLFDLKGTPVLSWRSSAVG
jgi:hypothetical protein